MEGNKFLSDSVELLKKAGVVLAFAAIFTVLGGLFVGGIWIYWMGYDESKKSIINKTTKELIEDEGLSSEIKDRVTKKLTKDYEQLLTTLQQNKDSSDIILDSLSSEYERTKKVLQIVRNRANNALDSTKGK